MFLSAKIFSGLALSVFLGLLFISPGFGQEKDSIQLHFNKNFNLNSQKITSIPVKELYDELKTFELFEENIRRGFHGYELFREAGYDFTEICVQPVSFNLDPNISVIKRGVLDECILIGAHYDIAGKNSQGIVDNASGIVEVTNLAEVFRDVETKFTYQFVLFGDEEIGLYGSEDFICRLSPEQRAKIRLMINIDSIGRDQAGYCSSVSDVRLVSILKQSANKLGLTLGPCSLFPECNSDHNNFAKYGIPIIFISSKTADQIHTYQDNLLNIQMDEVEKVHHLLIEFVTKLDGNLIPLNPKLQ
jgi:hypothetical protein